MVHPAAFLRSVFVQVLFVEKVRERASEKEMKSKPETFFNIFNLLLVS